MSLPVIFATVAKKDPREHPDNNSFASLSAEARLFVLKAGTVPEGQSKIDEISVWELNVTAKQLIKKQNEYFHPQHEFLFFSILFKEY